MESFFFGVDLERYRDTLLDSGLYRVDVSSGLVYLHASSPVDAGIKLNDRDRMTIMVFVQHGNVSIINDEIKEIIPAECIGVYASKQQNWSIRFQDAKGFVLFVSDFFLKRYYDNHTKGVPERFCDMMESGGTLMQISIDPLDALSVYLIDKITQAPHSEPMRSLRGEHRVVELLLHRIGMYNFLPDRIDHETMDIVSNAKAILELEFVDPPSIKQLAHRCATNTTKLKKMFKHIYGTTIFGYVQQLRMEEANLLLRYESISIKEVALRVGYHHQGHFSRLFYETYGIYPKALK
jgi:AraC-like DNA-binding protein